MSSDLIWLLTKKNNSFLVKRGGHQLSGEPGNLKNVNAPTYSGLANKKTIDLQPEKGGKGVVLTIRSSKVSPRKVAKSTRSIVLKRHFRASANAIRKITKDHRPDLTQTALARLTLLSRASKVTIGAKKISKKQKK